MADLVSKEFFEFLSNPKNMVESLTKKMADSPESKKGREEKDKSQSSVIIKEKIEEDTLALPPNHFLKESNKSI